MDLFIKEGDNYVPYSGPKLIPESDLMAAKGGLEGEVRQLKSELQDAKSTADSNYQRAIKAEADVTTLRTEVAPLKEKASQVETLTTQLQAATTGRTELETKLLGVTRAEVAKKHNLTGDKLKELDNLSADQLTQLDETLSKFGVTPPQQNQQNQQQQPPVTRNQFDTGGGGFGSPPASAPRGRDLIKEGLKESAAAGS